MAAVTQKGVDMRIGLDIANITAKKLCTKLVLFSNDADMIPAMKMARKEGVHVFLHTFNRSPLLKMWPHADVVVKDDDLQFSHQIKKEDSQK